MFASFPTYFRYRTLQLTNPILKGEDCYALQTALNGTGFSAGVADGLFGSLTHDAVRAAQRELGLVVDGKAGQKTQTALTVELANLVRGQFRLPMGLPIGQLRHESGCFLGNYSPIRDDGSYDAGVAQRNTAYTPAKEGFTAPASIAQLAKNTRAYYDKYTKVTDVRRRWTLAVGAWNAPGWTDRLAAGQSLSVAQSQHIEAYMASAAAYMVL